MSMDFVVVFYITVVFIGATFTNDTPRVMGNNISVNFEISGQEFSRVMCSLEGPGLTPTLVENDCMCLCMCLCVFIRTHYVCIHACDSVCACACM